MRALGRHCLAPFVLAVAALSAGVPAYHAATAPAHSGVAAYVSRSCPQGTNWDGSACV
jgi:hypothetical protein